MPPPHRFLPNCAASLALALLAASPAAGQPVDPPAVTYPATLERPTLVAWLGKETDVRPETVVAVTPEAAVAVMQSRVVGGAIAVVVRAEILTPEAYARDKILSWHATIQVDCTAGRIRQGATTGYGARNLLFDGRTVRAADTEWVAPTPGDPLDQVRRAVCEKSFQPPLTSSSVAVVTKAPARPAPAPPRQAAPPPAARPTASAGAAASARPDIARAQVSVQVAAAGSEAEAQRVLSTLKSRLAEALSGLETRVVRATVGGKIYHRALVLGFPDRAAAAAFCAGLKASGQACFVRNDRGG